MKLNARHMPKPVPRSQAEIYRSIRDMVIRSHCARKGEAHRCVCAIPIIRIDIILNCHLCGDLCQTLASAD